MDRGDADNSSRMDFTSKAWRHEPEDKQPSNPRNSIGWYQMNEEMNEEMSEEMNEEMNKEMKEKIEQREIDKRRVRDIALYEQFRLAAILSNRKTNRKTRSVRSIPWHRQLSYFRSDVLDVLSILLYVGFLISSVLLVSLVIHRQQRWVDTSVMVFSFAIFVYFARPQLRYLFWHISTSETSCAQNKQRVRWSCKACRKKGFSDLIETCPGGLQTLKERYSDFYRIDVDVAQNTQRSSSGWPALGIFLKIIQSVADIDLSLFSLQSRHKKASTLPQHNQSIANPTTAVLPGGAQPGSAVSPLLLSCMQSGNRAKRLHQPSVQNIQTDRDLFIFLRELFAQHRGGRRSWFTLWELSSLDVVRFQLFTQDVVTVVPHITNCGDATSCHCLPPTTLVEPSPNAEYRCGPIPPSTNPPILPSMAMHMYLSPDCISTGQCIIITQLPKRICGKLQESLTQVTTGWGISFHEGLDMKRIVWLVLVMFVLSSTLFGILWTTLEKDMQAAFGVSSWIVALGAILVTLIVLYKNDGFGR